MTRFADINGISLRYEFREGHGPLLVLIHEMGGTLEIWDRVLPHLQGRASLRLDLRGFGLSEKPRKPVELDELAADVIGLIDHVGHNGPVLPIGGAVGAAVAIAVADKLGSRTAGLIALAPATGLPRERHTGVEKLAAMLRAEGVREFIETDTVPKAWPADLIPRGPGFEIFRALQLSVDPASLAETYLMLTRIDLAPVLAALPCPALLVAGRHDVARPRSLVEPLALPMPNARFVELDTGHFMALQTPELVAKLIIGFVDGLD